MPSPPSSDAVVPVETPVALGKAHARRLRQIYRSAGWPCQDLLEIELLAAGMLERRIGPLGHESLRVTEAGVQLLARSLAQHRAALSTHEALVERVALEMGRAGRIAWRGLSLRAQVPGPGPELTPAAGPRAMPVSGGPLQWYLARPDVFSIRNTSVAQYVEPIVHEVKVQRADLLGDLRQANKRAAYLDLGECWYVLGQDARGRCIADPDEVPPECGVLLLDQDRLVVARAAPRPARQGLPFGVWMALAKATPVTGLGEDCQGLLGEVAGPD